MEQVAERLGLHVRTVRGYIRDGRLNAVRIGKQYRISQADLDAFTGRPARPRVEVSAVVEVEDVGARSADRLSTFLIAGVQNERDGLRLQVIHDDARSRLKVIVMGGPAVTADVLRTIHDLLETEIGDD